MLREYFMTKRGERAQAVAQKRAEADSVRLAGGDTTKVEYPAADPDMFESEEERTEISYAFGNDIGYNIAQSGMPIQLVTLPSAASKSEIVSGMRSPCSSARTMTNCPGCAERATRGARTFISQMPSARSLFSRMGYIISVVCLCVTLR